MLCSTWLILGFTYYVNFPVVSSEESEGPEIICEETIKVILNRTDIERLEVVHPEDAGEKIYISWNKTSTDSLAAECLPAKRTPTSIEFSFNFAACTPYVTEDAMNVYFTHTIRHKYMLQIGGIIRYRYSAQTVTCRFSRQDRTISSSNAVRPYVRVNTFDGGNVTGHFNVSMRLFTNESYLLNDGDIIDINQKILTRVHLENHAFVENNTKLVIKLDKCFASQSPDDITETYPILEDSCPAINIGDSVDSNLLIANGVAESGEFEFTSFAWANVADDGDQQIYVSCYVELCDSHLRDCSVHCGNTTNRRRRELVEAETNQLIHVSAGPLIVAGHRHHGLKSNPQPCSKVNGGCSDICITEDRTASSFCVCNRDRKLLSDGKTCINMKDVNAMNTWLQRENFLHDSLLAGVAFLLLLLCVCAIFTLLRKKEGHAAFGDMKLLPSGGI